MQYEVHFLVEKKVIVCAIDDIQAELEAARQLSREERLTVRGYQYTDTTFETPLPLKEFCEVDFDWWKDHNLLD